MESISIRNMDLKYYVITYLLGKQEAVYFIVSSSEKTAITYFLSQIKESDFNVTADKIIRIKALEILNPN